MILQDPGILVLLSAGLMASIIILMQRGHAIRQRFVELSKHDEW